MANNKEYIEKDESFWWKKNYENRKNIAYFSCLRGVIDYMSAGLDEGNGNLMELHQKCLETWEKWYRKEYPRPDEMPPEEEKEMRDRMKKAQKENQEKKEVPTINV